MKGWRRLRVACSVTAILTWTGCTMIGAPRRPEAAPPPDHGPLGAGTRDVASILAMPEPEPRAEPPAATGNMEAYEQDGRVYRVLETSEGYDRRGVASWYGEPFHGRRTSSGETYDMFALTAAHRTLPIPCYVEVTNLANGRRVILRVNDRGPFHDPDRRIIDVSYAAAVKLGMVGTGTAPVRVRALPPYQTRTSR